jgi:hypothetical protein
MSRLRFALGCVGLFLTLTSTGWAAGRWDEAAGALASKIVLLAGPGTATLEIRNNSTIPTDQVAAIRRVLDQQLRAEGLLIRKEHEASVGVRVTLAENRRGRIWIAEVQQGTETRVTMLELPEEKNPEANVAAPWKLQAQLLLSLSEPLLDVQMVRSAQTWLVVLTSRAVLLYEQKEGRWQPARELLIAMDHPLPRDVRGRIVPTTDHAFDVFLPGMVCAATADKKSQLGLNCIASDDPWPLGAGSGLYNPARNYFTALLTPGLARNVPPFYSAVAVPRAKYTLWVFAGVDGRVTAFDGVNERRMGLGVRGWGSDIAAIHSNCGSGTQILTGEASGVEDALLVFEVPDREPVAVAPALKLDGTVDSLWSLPGAEAATVIVHTEQGNYDAYTVSLYCGR